MRLNVNIKDSQYRELTRIADEDGRTISDIVRALVADHIRRRNRDDSMVRNRLRVMSDEGSSGQEEA